MIHINLGSYSINLPLLHQNINSKGGQEGRKMEKKMRGWKEREVQKVDVCCV